MATTNYGWVTPTVGGSSGAWGDLLNTIFQAIDTALFSVSTVAAAALARAGGALTGRLDLLTATMACVNKGSVSGAQSFDLSLAQYFTLTVSGAISLSFASVPSGAFATALVLRVTNGGALVTWPASVKWPSAVVPTLTVAGTDLVVLITDDNGVTWRGVVSGRDIH